MTIDELSASVLEIVSAHINSVEQIAVLRLLRSEPNRAWSVDAISAELRSATSSIRRRLDDLYAEGVLAHTGDEVRFAPASSAMAEAIEQLLEAYRDRPNRIIELIYAKPAQSLHAFADAFRLKKEKG